MSILPLDLQVSFAQMNEVGKEQSKIEENPQKIQSHEANLLQSISKDIEKKIVDKNNTKKENNKVSEELLKKKNYKDEKNKKQKKVSIDESDDEFFSKDPYLGNFIDIKE